MGFSYCEAAAGHPLHKAYHENEYGFPLRDDAALFARLVLEINQAGLSWTTILQKKENFFRAYDNFEVARVASYGEEDRARLLADAGIIRNRLKVNAAIENARRICVLQADHGSFCAWLDAHHPLPKDEWVKLFKQTFLFTGGEMVKEFLISTGSLPGAHDATCPVYARIAALNPPWMAKSG
jgi:DNA-3-methyladenine glycosylase I